MKVLFESRFPLARRSWTRCWSGSLAIALALAPLLEAQSVKLSSPLARSVPRTILGFHGVPGGQRVVYWGDQDTDEVFELYGVSSSGSDRRIVLGGMLVPGGDVGGGLATRAALDRVVQISPDGERVVYAADQEVDGRIELYSVKPAGGPRVKLNGSLVEDGDIAIVSSARPFQVAPDGSRVVYLADQRQDEVIELFSVPTAR